MEVRGQARVNEGGALRLRTSGVAAGAVALLCVAVAVTGVDVSAWRDFETDAVMLQAPRVSEDRYHDPSGHSMWLPSDLFVRDSVRRGELPLWNRRQGGGYSTINSIHEGVFHPFRWVTALAPRSTAPTVLIVLALSSAAIGMYLFARTALGSREPAALTMALVYAFSPLLISNVHFSGAILPLAHVPWAVLFLRASGKGRGLLGLVITLTLMFMSGHPLIEVTALATIGGVALMDALFARTVRPIVVLAAAAGAAVLLAAPALLPPLVAAPDFWTYKTQTAQGTSYFAYEFGAWVDALRSMVFDRFEGPCCIDADRFYLFLGLPAIVLAMTGVWYGIHRADTRALVVLMVLAFLISVPGPWMAIVRVPPVSFFKPWYLMGAFSFYFAATAGKGVDFLLDRRRFFRIVAVFLIAGTAVLNVARALEVLRPRILREEPRSGAVEALKERSSGPFRVLSLWGQTHMPNASSLTGLEDFRLASPVLTLRYHLFWQLIDEEVLRRAYPTTRITANVQAALLRDFNIAYVLQSRLPPTGTFRTSADEALRDTALAPATAELPVAVRTPWLDVRRMARDVRPRAHFADQVIAVPSARESLSLLSEHPDVVEKASVVEVDPPQPIGPGRGHVVLRYPAESRVVMDVRSAGGGLVVLHDSFADGWSATMDGDPVEIHPVNLLSRGVLVPPGAHRIEMSYAPPGLAAGVAVTVATALVLLFMKVRATRVGAGAQRSV
jgi:hypothetical protein